MKLRRLPETDLARIAPLAYAEKQKRLEAHKATGGAWSYDPARSQYFPLANPRNPLGLRSGKPRLEQITDTLRKLCKVQEQLDSCIEIVELFDHWLSRETIDAFEFRLPSMPIGSLGGVRFWENFAVLADGRPTFIWSDCRRRRGLNRDARKFVFSMMHQHIRIGYPDHFDAQLCILQYPVNGEHGRSVQSFFVDDDDLFEFSELSGMIEETYSLWAEVLDDRRRDEPKRASGGLF